MNVLNIDAQKIRPFAVCRYLVEMLPGDREPIGF
jgi:hypothetical protein